jgi:hypothetical protein
MEIIEIKKPKRRWRRIMERFNIVGDGNYGEIIVYQVSNGDWCKSEEAVGRIQELEEALYGLLDGLDANHDERCGLTQEQWDKRIKEARRIAKGGE